MRRVAQAIPAATLQTYSFLLSESTSSLPLMSIAMSILAISYATTLFCFDFDLDPERRAQAPKFYGFVPSNSRSRLAVMLTMFTFSVCHITMKILGVALLATVSAFYLFIFLLGDMVMYLLYKAWRQDLRYWLRLEGALSWLASFLFRFFIKILVDYTALVQLR